MRSLLLIFAFCGLAQPAAAQFTTTYAGTQTEGGAAVPATALFYVDAGRAATIITGARVGRMVFDAKAQVLHLISDADKTYIDIDKSGRRGDPVQMMQQQLDRMPPGQRAMAEQMMRTMTSAMPPPLTYVRSTEKKTIAGYESPSTACAAPRKSPGPAARRRTT